MVSTTPSISCFAHPTKDAMERSLSEDRKSTRLNSSHLVISYAVFCLKKKISPPAGYRRSLCVRASLLGDGGFRQFSQRLVLLLLFLQRLISSNNDPFHATPLLSALLP